MSQNRYFSELATRNNRASNNPVSTLHTDINNLFDDFFNFKMPKLRSENNNYPLPPPVDIIESEKSFKISLELSGIDKKDVDITIKDSAISVKCKREESIKKEEENYIVKEMYYGQLERHVKIPETADVNTAKASFKDGILSIHFDKKPESISKEIKLEIK